MAVNDAALAAITSAIDAAPSADRSDSRKRFLIMLEAALPHLQSAVQGPPSPEVTMLATFTPSDETRPAIERLNEEIKGLIKQALAGPASEQSNQTVPAAESGASGQAVTDGA